MSWVEMAGGFMLASIFVFAGGGLLVLLVTGTWVLIDGLRSSDKPPLDEEKVRTARNNLYEALPSGDIDAFALIKIIKTHITEIDEILGEVHDG